MIASHLTEHDIRVNNQRDALTKERQDARTTFEYWKAQCLAELTPQRVEALRQAAERLYDEQLEYITDAVKRASAVQRYVDEALTEVGAGWRTQPKW